MSTISTTPPATVTPIERQRALASRERPSARQAGSRSRTIRTSSRSPRIASPAPVMAARKTSAVLPRRINKTPTTIARAARASR